MSIESWYQETRNQANVKFLTKSPENLPNYFLLMYESLQTLRRITVYDLCDLRGLLQIYIVWSPSRLRETKYNIVEVEGGVNLFSYTFLWWYCALSDSIPNFFSANKAVIVDHIFITARNGFRCVCHYGKVMVSVVFVISVHRIALWCNLGIPHHTRIPPPLLCTEGPCTVT